MSEYTEIMRQISRIQSSIARRVRLAAKSDDANYAAVVRQSIELDRDRVRKLRLRAADWSS